jgi:hypothetical protein
MHGAINSFDIAMNWQTTARWRIVRKANIVPLNEAASAAGVPTLNLVLYSTGYGPVTGTMPDGESLTGHYHLTWWPLASLPPSAPGAASQQRPVYPPFNRPKGHS